MLVERIFQYPTHRVGFGLLPQRNFLADCLTQIRILLMDVSIVRVSKACGDLMDRGWPVRLEGLFRISFKRAAPQILIAPAFLHQWLWPESRYLAAIR